MNDKNIDVTAITEKKLYEKFKKGMVNDKKPKFQIDTLSKLILKRHDEVGKASRNIQKDLFNILNISE